MGKLEICVDSCEGFSVCDNASVDRIELCSALNIGGLTPSAGLMSWAAQHATPTMAMIRPREGNFCFNAHEVTIMHNDIATAKSFGLAGVVLGAATSDHSLDISTLTNLCNAAGSMTKTLHRVIDTLDDPLLALEQAIDLGFDYVLTSGSAACVFDGVNTLQQLQSRAAGRIQIMAGAGLKHHQISSIHQRTGITHFHASCRRADSMEKRFHELGFSAASILNTDLALIRQFQHAISELR